MSNTAYFMASSGFHPETYVLPAEREAFLAADKAARKQGEQPPVWIGKPNNMWAGKGLVVTPSAKLLADGKGVVQKYITRPLLIGGYKFHMRVRHTLASLSFAAP